MLYMERIYNRKKSKVKKKKIVNIETIPITPRLIQRVNQHVNNSSCYSLDSLATVDEILQKENITDAEVEYMRNRLLDESSDEICEKVNRLIGDLKKNISNAIVDNTVKE